MTSGMNNKYFVRASKVVILVVLGVVAVVLLTVNIEDLRQASSTGAAIIAPAQSSSGEYKAARAKGGVRYTGRYVNGTREEVDTPRILLNVQAVGKRVGTRIYPLLADEAREGPAGVQRNNARNLDVECLEGVSTNSSEQQGRWPAGCCSGGSLEVGVSSQISPRYVDGADCEEPACTVYDLRNVAVQNDVLHVYAPGAETSDVLERWGHRLPMEAYRWGGFSKAGKKIVIHDELLHESFCLTRSHGVSFYFVPHFQENTFHLHNDNILPMASSILSTPCLCNGTELGSCTRRRKTLILAPPKKQTHGHVNPEFLEIFRSLFDEESRLNTGKYGTSLAPVEAKNGLHCLDHMVWGYQKPFYVEHMPDRRSTVWAWQYFLMQKLGLHSQPPPSQMPRILSPPPKDAIPRVLFLRRTVVQSGPEKSDRFMSDRGPFQRAWEAMGIHMDEWLYESNAALSSVLGSLAGYDIYIGVHGAQLANIVYGAPGLVLVEVQSMLWARDSFRRVAKAKYGGYVRVNTIYKSHFQLGDLMAAKVVRCAMALWRREDSIACDEADGVGKGQSPDSIPLADREGVVLYEEVGPRR
ncbi:unnamed protein product [Ascophyllum nodosum]